MKRSLAVAGAIVVVAVTLSIFANVSSEPVLGELNPQSIGRGETDRNWKGKKRMRLLAREKLPSPYEELKPLHTLMPEPGPSDWLANHEETGMSCRKYVRCKPIRPGKQFKKIYILPFGTFSPKQQEILKLTAKYMELYFGMPVVFQKAQSDKLVPKGARRDRRWYGEQILTTWVLYNVLKPRRPKDALAYIAFTAKDLWPGEGWNFVYGQASLRQRIGVWSIARNGNPAESKEAFKLCLKRTIHTGTHETGHILTMEHCIAYLCNMNGANHRKEADRSPLALCPLCQLKLCWNTGAKPIPRMKGLQKFCDDNGLKDEAAFFAKSIEIMEKLD